MNAHLTWTPAGGTNSASQDVQYKKITDSAWTTYANVGQGTTSQDVLGLLDNQLYNFRIVNNCTYNGPTAGLGTSEKVSITCPTVTITDRTPITISYSFSHLGGSISEYDVDLLDSTSTNVLNTNVHTSPGVTVSGQFASLTANTSYNIRVRPKTVGIGTYQKNDCAVNPTATLAFSTQWVANTYSCEQDGLFTLANTFSNLSSPLKIFFDDPTARCYVADLDNATGNTYWFDPANTISSLTTTVVSGFSQVAYTAEVDAQYRRIYYVGKATGGLVVLDIPSNTYSTVPYGTNGVDFNRITIGVMANKIYCQDRGDATVTLIDRATLAVTGSIAVSSIPSGTTYFDAYTMTSIGSEIWISSVFNASSNIAIYNSALTSLNSTITLPGAAVETFSKYRGSTFYDAAKNRLYVADAGSSKLFVIDTINKVVVATKTFTNNLGKAFMLAAIVQDPMTGDLYVNVTGYNNASDLSPTHRFYIMDRQTYDLTMLFPSSSINSLTLQTNTNVLWATFAGLPQWQGGAWATDGQIYKYTR